MLVRGVVPAACAVVLLLLSVSSEADTKDGVREVLPVSRVIRSLVYEDSVISEQDKAEDDDNHGREKRQINFGDGQPATFPGAGRPFGGRPGGGRPFGNGRPASFPGGVQPGAAPTGGIPQPTGTPSASSTTCANCVSLAACSFVVESAQTAQPCQIPGSGAAGVCCPERGAGSNNRQLFTSPRINVNMDPVSTQEINSACEKGISFIQDLGRQETQLIGSNTIVQPNTPESGHLRFFRTTRSARDTHTKALQIAQASKNMMSDLRLSPAQGGHGLRQLQVRNSILANNCPVAPRCNPSAKYRTVDGTCNNLGNPMYGKSETAFQRILPPMYDDGVSAPRTRSAAPGQPLPSVRVVASSVLVDRNDPDQEFTLSVMQWGQFIDHDLTHAPFPSLNNGDGIECCPNGREAQGANRHPECWPIKIPENDGFYAPRNRFCMNFVRSMLGLNQECTFGYAEQMNQITHWLDGSNIYGSDTEEANRLRTGRGGLFGLSRGNLLPINTNAGRDCEATQRGAQCYLAGDSRVNEQPGLTAIHILFHREHNRVASLLQQLHPTWSDEALYQEARRIVIAEYQHIIFNEWLPIIVGPRFMDSFGINVLQRGYSFDYTPEINPNMNNEFATGAFRFGHSLVQGTINLVDARGNANSIQLREHFNSPHIFQTTANVIDSFSRALSRTAIQKFDSFVTGDLTNHLFQTPRQNFGMDLMSLNLHRGRDHAIASYNSIREVCGLPRARTFADFNDQIPIGIVNRLSQLYAHPDDVDYFVGGMSEKPVSGGLLGWTFLCVVGDQFARVKKGDRFFYDIGGQPGSFNEVQLNEIRKASWARILCDNSDNLEGVQPLAFRLPNNNFNRVLPCQTNDIPRVDLRAWAREVPRA